MPVTFHFADFDASPLPLSPMIIFATLIFVVFAIFLFLIFSSALIFRRCFSLRIDMPLFFASYAACQAPCYACHIFADGTFLRFLLSPDFADAAEADAHAFSAAPCHAISFHC